MRNRDCVPADHRGVTPRKDTMAEDTPRERREDRGSEGRGPRGGGDGRRRGGDRDGRPRSGAGDRRRSGGPHEDRRRGPGQDGGRPERRGAPTGPRREDRAERPAHNPGDLRAANRADQERSPDIDPDVTGKELDRGTNPQGQLHKIRRPETTTPTLTDQGACCSRTQQCANTSSQPPTPPIPTTPAKA